MIARVMSDRPTQERGPTEGSGRRDRTGQRCCGLRDCGCSGPPRRRCPACSMLPVAGFFGRFAVVDRPLATEADTFGRPGIDLARASPILPMAGMSTPFAAWSQEVAGRRPCREMHCRRTRRLPTAATPPHSAGPHRARPGCRSPHPRHHRPHPPWLMPHNPAYDPIPGDDATILGKVVAVLRSQ